MTVVVLGLTAAACGGAESSDATSTTTAPSSATTTTTAAVTTTTTMSAPAATRAATTTTAAASSAPGSDEELPTRLAPGTYLVGSEIRSGFWVPDECGCLWAHVDEAGTETPGPGEDAEVQPTDHAIKLDGCGWTWDG